MKIGVMFGNPETTTGGHALKFYASVRLDIRRIGPVKSGDEVVGNRTRVKVVKNKLAPPFQRGRVRHPLRQRHRRDRRPDRLRGRARRAREARRVPRARRRDDRAGTREGARVVACRLGAAAEDLAAPDRDQTAAAVERGARRSRSPPRPKPPPPRNQRVNPMTESESESEFGVGVRSRSSESESEFGVRGSEFRFNPSPNSESEPNSDSVWSLPRSRSRTPSLEPAVHAAAGRAAVERGGRRAALGLAALTQQQHRTDHTGHHAGAGQHERHGPPRAALAALVVDVVIRRALVPRQLS